MPLLVPPMALGGQEFEASNASTAADGTTLTGSTADTKPTSYTTLIAATGRAAFGIAVRIGGMTTSATDTSGLVDIAIGAAASETIIIPDLAAGWSNTQLNGHDPFCYYFPLYIPSGVRISGRLQSHVASDTATVEVWLNERPRMDGWTGARVTAYGVSSSHGTNVTSGNNVYGTAAQIIASTTNRIRYLQAGIQGGQDVTASSVYVRFRIQSGSTALVSDLPFTGNSTEWIEMSAANFLLSQCLFDIPAATQLQVATMQNGVTNPTYDFILYGVD